LISDLLRHIPGVTRTLTTVVTSSIKEGSHIQPAGVDIGGFKHRRESDRKGKPRQSTRPNSNRRRSQKRSEA
jgi:hypothetical protein